MESTRRRKPLLDFLHPSWALAFLAIAVVWFVVASSADWQSPESRAVARIAGYVGFLAMLVPYLHIVRRSFRARHGIAMTTWLRWHVGAAYLAFFMVLIHSRGRSSGNLAQSALLWLTWAVMLSGVVGYYGQKLLYLMMPKIVPREYGLERLGAEAERKLADAEGLIAEKDMAGAAGIVGEFCQSTLTGCLKLPLSFSPRDWFRGRKTGPSLLSKNGLERAKSFATEKQKLLLDELWGLVEARRSMDLEYRLHQVGRLWLYVHGPAAWALFVLMVEHVVMSIWYGGF